MQRAGAAEGHEREVAWVDAALDRHPAHGLHHGRVDHRDDAIRVDAGLVERVRGPRCESRRSRPGKAASSGMRPGHQIGVGDCRLRATPAVTGGSGLGAGAARADRECAPGVDAGDGATARADGVHVERRAAAPGRPPTVRWAAGSGRPSMTRHTSVLVPPMSKVTASGKPAATAAAAPASTPAAGPDSSRAAGRSAASSSGTSPPADVITSTSGAKAASRCR